MYRVKLVLLASLCLGAVATVAQQSPAPTATPVPGAPQATPPVPGAAPSVFATSYPTRPPADPAVVQKGRQIFSANCSFCHGSDARGGEGGPNLIRSELVLDDQNGEKIEVVVKNGRVDKGMPKFDLTTPQIAGIAAWLHSIPVGGRAEVTGTVNPLVGDAHAGETFFNGGGKCSSCHSVTGDLAGIGGKIHDVRMLQGAILSGEPRGESAEIGRKTVTVTLPGGKAVEGRLYTIDDFSVSLVEADGTYHSYQRHGAVPKVVVHDPLQPHLDMLTTLTDDEIHNLTAYLVTLK